MKYPTSHTDYEILNPSFSAKIILTCYLLETKYISN